MNDIILHHYPPSPGSEKVRVVLGIKGLAWRSVEIPGVPPKPLLMPLTGGCRRTPVMQVGADIYCDSHIILRELHGRHPVPALEPQGVDGGLGPVQVVRVVPDADSGETAVQGVIRFVDQERNALLRDDPEAGWGCVHFPRAGYCIET